MRVAVVGDFAGRPEEGMKVVSRRVEELAAKNYDTISFNIRDTVTLSGIKTLRNFRPDLVHFVAGPSVRTAAVLRLVALACPRTTRVLSALHPIQVRAFWRLSIGCRPHLVLAHSKGATAAFATLGANVRHQPIGVDASRFEPAGDMTRRVARIQEGLPESEKPIVLHVGHLKAGRGVEALADAAASGWCAVMLVSGATKPDPVLRQVLSDAGVKFLSGFRTDVGKVYALADVYLFPTESPAHAIQTPLSVLEAMACNLPVVTTSFGGIEDVFPEGEGLLYWRRGQTLVSRLETARMTVPVRTRQRLLSASLVSTPEQLSTLYRSVATGGGTAE